MPSYSLFQAGLFLGGVGGDRRPHRLGRQHGVDHGAPVRQVRPDHRGADAPEVDAQHPCDLAREPLRPDLAGLLQHAAQRHRRGKMHYRVAPVQQQRQQAAETADHHPVFRKQHAEPAGLPAWRAPDVDRHRHDLDVEVGRAFERTHQLAQRFAGGALAAASEQPAVATGQREHGATPAGTGQRPHRAGQAGLATGTLQDQRIGEAVALDHVAHRHARLQQGRRLGGVAAYAHPGLQQLPGQVEPPGGAATYGGVHHCGIRHRTILPGPVARSAPMAVGGAVATAPRELKPFGRALDGIAGAGQRKPRGPRPHGAIRQSRKGNGLTRKESSADVGGANVTGSSKFRQHFSFVLYTHDFIGKYHAVRRASIFCCRRSAGDALQSLLNSAGSHDP